ncbi:MAG TPA: nuclear transport factor 2 family protein [Gemmatimonadales bacterium]|nr:nuclear transport factor 2 family protein [Gemmatimonadales bacterium]
MTALETLTAKDHITTRIHDLFIATDQRDWDKVRGCFTEQVHFDMTSLAGGSPQYLTPRQITDSWQAGFQALEHVHHQAGNLQIALNRNTAEAFCYGIALHYRTTKSGENVRRFVGSYDFSLQREGSNWLISSFRYNVKFVDGNLTLETSP